MPKTMSVEGKWDELIEQYPELRGKRVRVIVLQDEEELPVGSAERVFKSLELIHARLRAAGHEPPTRTIVDTRVEQERSSWEE